MGINTPIDNSAVATIVRLAMVPFVRLLLRYGVSYKDFSDIVKRVYVEVAEKEFLIEGRQQTVARIAVLTGLTRRGVKEVMVETTEEKKNFSMNRAGKVASGWMRDKTFWSEDGQPAALTVSGTDKNSFSALVKKYGGDVPVRPVIDELLRLGAIKRKGNSVVLASTGYVPSGDSAELLKVAFRSVGDLIGTIDNNDQDQNNPQLQLSVSYDNLSNEGVEGFRILSREKSKELLITLDQFLSTQDRDQNPEVKGDGKRRAGLGIYYFTDPDQSTAEREE